MVVHVGLTTRAVFLIWTTMEHREIAMASFYTAAVVRNPGRKALNVEFRHPLRIDSNNKPGKKTRKALGTDDENEARELVAKLNDLLANERLWSLGARAEALPLYGEKVTEIFYGEIEPRRGSASELRDKLLPLPSRTDGYARVLLMGVPGAGKTTLVRQLIGTHPKSERFPATSVNRTTTFPTEVALVDGHYEAVVTFMSEHETRFEIEEALSAAISEAIEGSPKQVAREFLEKSDMRFRLKYLLGDYASGQDEVDPYEEVEANDLDTQVDIPNSPTEAEQTRNKEILDAYIDRILNIASQAKLAFESKHGSIADLVPQDRNASLERICEAAVSSDEFIALVSDVLDELRTKFDFEIGGRFDKTTTGWPRAWQIKTSPDQRTRFLRDLHFFSDNHHKSWGKLVTPLVNGMRVKGPFKPSWVPKVPRLVILDTEGLGHKSDATADLPEQVLPLLDEADVILLVESAKNGMTNFAAGKALEAIVNTGHTRKSAVVFTSMDLVKGDNLRGQAKIDHVFGGLRNIIDNQLAKNVSTDAARDLLKHLEGRTFYVGRINEADPTPAKPELNKLLQCLMTAQPPALKLVAIPKYRDEQLGFAIQEAAREFRQRWKGYLGHLPDVRGKHHNTIKALSRRYAEGWDDGFVLRPTSNFVAALSAAISRFLETPIGWTGDPTPDQTRETIDRIKSTVTRSIPNLSIRRLREYPQPLWQDAYSLRGTGSAKPRANRIEGIFEKFVPVPDATSRDREVWDFLDEVKKVVVEAIDEIEKEISTTHNDRSSS
jgi:ethanolamine utilization protein EutP (predicted NTPase)